MVSKFAISILLFLFSGIALGQLQNISVKEFRISIPKNWSYAKDLFGLPHVFLAPKNFAHRASFTIIPSQNKNIDLSITSSNSEEIKVFQKNKENWINSRNGKLVKHLQYQKIQNKNLKSVHTLGIEFQLDNHILIEKSYYFYCLKNLYLAKSLVLTNDEQGKKDIENMFLNLRCP